MAGRFEVVSCLMVIVVVALVGAATAATHNVGDALGWQVPNGGAVQYEAWAARTYIRVGDTIVFNWTGNGNVVQVLKAGFDTCELRTILSPLHASSPASYTLISTNTQYYINSAADNCKLGQKVAITAKDDNISKTASPPSLLIGGALSAVFLALAVSFSIHM